MAQHFCLVLWRPETTHWQYRFHTDFILGFISGFIPGFVPPGFHTLVSTSGFIPASYRFHAGCMPVPHPGFIPPVSYRFHT
eukprot:9326639-Heterocapsa_arctica.AAC.1